MFAALAVAGTEVTVPGYARRPTTLAYAADGVTLCNVASIQWPAATAPWGVIDTVLLYDAATHGAPAATLPTVVPVEIRQYDIARIPASGIAAAVTLELAFARQALCCPPSAVASRRPRPYGVGAYGVGPYERYASNWIGPAYCPTGVWATPANCSTGTWARAA